MQMHTYKYFTKKAAEKKVEQPLQCIEKETIVLPETR